jgi:hypothetical protein
MRNVRFTSTQAVPCAQIAAVSDRAASEHEPTASGRIYNQRRGLNDFSVLSQPGYGGNIGRSRPPNVRSSGRERSRDVVDQGKLARGLAFD